MQLRLTVRRLQIGSWCIGMTQRALDMLGEHANQRVTFGQKLAEALSMVMALPAVMSNLSRCT